MDSIKGFYDRVFGNNDGRFTLSDLPNSAVLVVGVIVDLVMAFAEYRVYSVGYALTKSVMLALGFVAVSSLPFYLGQLAFLYNRANNKQQAISVTMVIVGLLVSAYYGFADYIIRTNTVLTVAEGVSLPMDIDSLYLLAVSATVALIIGGLLFVYFDDGVANRRKSNRIQGKAAIAQEEITIKRDMLEKLTALRLAEEALKQAYPEDYDKLQEQFREIANKKNFTNGSGKSR